MNGSPRMYELTLTPINSCWVWLIGGWVKGRPITMFIALVQQFLSDYKIQPQLKLHKRQATVRA